VARRLLQLICSVGAAALASASLQGQIVSVATSLEAPAPFIATNPALQASLERIASRSPLWREAAAKILQAGRHAVVVTPDQVLMATPPGVRPTDGADAGLLAEVAPIVGRDDAIDAAIVVVNLAVLEEEYRDSDLPLIEFQRDLDRILAHEIYGHAVPYLLAGHLSGRCADPQPRERPSDACAIKRENAIRSELGLGRRLDSGLDGLSLSRRSRR